MGLFTSRVIETVKAVSFFWDAIPCDCSSVITEWALYRQVAAGTRANGPTGQAAACDADCAGIFAVPATAKTGDPVTLSQKLTITFDLAIGDSAAN